MNIVELKSKINDVLSRDLVQKLQILFFLVIAANLFWQIYQRKPLEHYGDWDIHHAAYMGNSVGLFGIENASEGFQTYGPIFPWIIASVGPASEVNNYWTMMLWMALWLSVFYLFLKSSELPHVFLWVGLVLCLFNFPNFTFSPWLMILWCLSKPDSTGLKLGHAFLGIIYVSVILMFKFSYGFIAFAQLVIWCLFTDGNLKKGLSIALLYGLGVIFVSTLMYFNLTNGTLESLVTYIHVSWVDAKSYSSLMPLPLSFMESTIVFIWPIILIFLISLTFYIKTDKPCWWLPLMLLPVTYAEFRHSYNRCDYSNLKGTFFMTGVIAFCLMVRYYHLKRVRYGALIVITFLGVATFAKELPRNVPWRHPRLVWLRTPWEDSRLLLEKRKESNKNLDDYLKSYSWIKNKVANESLGVTPAALCLTLLSEKPSLLPGVQNYYNVPLKEKMDLKALDKKKPEWMIYEHKNIDNRFPGSHHPKFINKLFSKYEFIENSDHLYLLKRREKERDWIAGEIYEYEIKNGICITGIEDLYSNEALFIKAKGLDSFMYQVQKILLRGERLVVDLGHEDNYVISLLELKRGVYIFPNLKSFLNTKKKEIDFKISIKGSLNRNFKSDPIYLLPELKLNGSLEIQKFYLN